VRMDMRRWGGSEGGVGREQDDSLFAVLATSYPFLHRTYALATRAKLTYFILPIDH